MCVSFSSFPRRRESTPVSSRMWMVAWVPAFMPKACLRHDAGMTLSPRLHPRAQVQLVRPGAAVLAVQLPVGLRDGVGVEDAVAILERGARGEVGADELGVDGAVDD